MPALVTPFISYSWFTVAGFWGTTIPGYARQFEAIDETITITSNLSTGGASFVQHLCMESGTTSPTRVINGPVVALVSITPIKKMGVSGDIIVFAHKK